jgi:2-hydroxycyclohexanecarboxyl-CoA dehydrogenase
MVYKGGKKMDLGLKGKTAIVTGAASNIGRVIALTLAQEGANVAIADIDEEGAQMVAKECEAKGVKALPIKTDVTSQDSVNAMVKQVADTFKTIDVLVNDAAIFITKPFMETEKAQWDKQINVNYYGTIYCCYAVLPYMKEQDGGRIISIGSDAGRIGENRQAVYSGTKGAIISFTKALALEVGRYGVSCNVVCPGATRPEAGAGKRGAWIRMPDAPRDPEREKAMLKLYPMGKPGRLGQPEDVANAVTYLASDQAYFVTGQVLSASGGYSRAG